MQLIGDIVALFALTILAKLILALKLFNLDFKTGNATQLGERIHGFKM
jgi:hypothetical protein